MKPWLILEHKYLILLLAVTLLLVLSTVALAQTGQPSNTRSLAFSWWTVDGGGGTSSGEGYSLSGTTGQADAGPVLSAGGYRLAGGFWGSVWGDATAEVRILLPLVQRNTP